MTDEEIKAEFDRFIEYPEGSDMRYVTTTSTLLFAKHVAQICLKNSKKFTQQRDELKKTGNF